MNMKSIKRGFLFVSFLTVFGFSLSIFAAPDIQTTLTDQKDGTEQVDVFTTDTPMIYANWESKDIHPGQKVRSVWIADDTHGAAPKNYKVDEFTLDVNDAVKANTITKSDNILKGTFNVNKPTTAAGWPVGNYHLEIYVDGTLVKKVPFSVEKKAS